MKYQWVVLSVTTVGVFMSGLDTRVVLIGLPTIGEALRADLETLLWITQGYQIAITIGLLFLGRLTDIYGRVKIYNVGFAVFTIGSAFCAFAQTGPQLILFRTLQGVGGGMLITNSAALITDATSPRELGFALGINQIAFRVGAVLGLTVGGILIVTTGWRTIFALNVPVGIFGTIWAHLRLREIAKTERRSTFDYVGLLSFTVSLTSLLLMITLLTMAAIDQVGAAILGSLSLATFIAFLYLEPRRAKPLLDMRLFKIRLFSAGNLSQLLFSLGFGAVSLTITLYFQLIRGFDALTAGLLYLPFEAAFVTVGPISGRLSDRYGTRWLATLGMGLGAAGYAAFAFLLTPTTSMLLIQMILVVIGVSAGMFTSPNISAIMGSVPAERRGVASAVRATVFNTANVVSIGLVAFIITTAVPYQVVSKIVMAGYIVLSPAESIGFVTGIGRAFIVIAIIALAGVFASSLRGPEKKARAAHGALVSE